LRLSAVSFSNLSKPTVAEFFKSRRANSKLLSPKANPKTKDDVAGSAAPPAPTFESSTS
jgi:hypothetical protein